MTNVEVVPAYVLIDYAWQVLQSNTDMQPSDYENRVPIIPASQQPEFTNTNKPFIVYAWSENPTQGISELRSGQISFVVYGSTDREIIKISNVLSTAFGRHDMSAESINAWQADRSYKGIIFTHTTAHGFEGPTPESQEGGRQSSLVMVRFGFIPNYSITVPFDPLG